MKKIKQNGGSPFETSRPVVCSVLLDLDVRELTNFDFALSRGETCCVREPGQTVASVRAVTVSTSCSA